jgi:hypothetical protein
MGTSPFTLAVGMIIDVPRTGLTVEKVSLHSSWYAQTVASAARP